MAVNLKFSGFDYAMHLRYCLQTFIKIMLPIISQIYTFLVTSTYWSNSKLETVIN